MRGFTICLFLSLFSFHAWTQKALKPIKSIPTSFTEPSDLLFLNDQFFVLGDKAGFFIMDALGKGDRQDFQDLDLEGITTDGQWIYLSEETYQRIWVWDPKEKKVLREIPFKHGGGRNEGVESLVFLPHTKEFILATEKDPNLFFRVDENFEIKEQFTIAGISEVSGMAVYQSIWYVLSDEASTIYQVDLASKRIMREWLIAVINAEGITFDQQGNAWVCSDDMQKVFQFKLPVP